MGALLAILGILGAFTAAKLSYQSNQQTNQTNQDIAQHTNQTNIDLAGQQNTWNLEQWARETAYNVPKAQMQRLRDAGLNPSLLYGQGTGILNEAAPSPELSSAIGSLVTPRMMATDFSSFGDAFNQSALTAAQARLADAQARKVDEETRYQQYLNAVEDQLQKIPVGEVHTVSENGEESYEVVYGNARVEITKRQLRALGLSTEGLQVQLSDLFYDLAVKTGSDLRDFSNPSQLPNYDSAVAALRGDQNTQKVAGQLADIGKQAAEAEKAGRQAYAKWLEEHKDDPVVKFALTLQGFFQTIGISLPHVGGSSSDYFRGSRGTASASSSSWYFGS